MEIPRFLWLGATTASVGILLVLMALETPQKGRDPGQPRQGWALACQPWLGNSE
jgi:hypothetical protein